AARRHERDLAVGHLTRPALPAHLPNALGEKAEAVEAAAGELAAPRVQRKLTAEPQASALDERTRFPALAEAERLEPCEREPAEAVVELDGVDVRRPDVRACPELLRRIAGCHRREVLPLIPDRARSDRRPDRMDADGGTGA